MTCYFQQNLAFVTFKLADQIHSVCRLRIYTKDDRLLTGRPRFASHKEQLQAQKPNITSNSCRAMSTHTNDQQDLSSQHSPIKRPHSSRRTQLTPRNNNHQQQSNKLSHNTPNNDMEIECNPQPTTSAVTNKNDHEDNSLPLPPLHTSPEIPSSFLDLILAKLNELDAIKKHLTTIDHRLDYLQTSLITAGMVANHS